MAYKIFCDGKLDQSIIAFTEKERDEYINILKKEGLKPNCIEEKSTSDLL